MGNYVVRSQGRRSNYILKISRQSTFLFNVKQSVFYRNIWTEASCFASIFVCAEPEIRSNFAGVAQLVEQLICNHQVGGSNPFTGSSC